MIQNTPPAETESPDGVVYLVPVPAALWRRVQERALEWGVQPEDVLRLGLEAITREPDAESQAITDAIFAENAELYRRLA